MRYSLKAQRFWLISSFLLFTSLGSSSAFADNRYCAPGDLPRLGGPFDGPAELPRSCVHSARSSTPSPGAVIQVPAGASLQAAINSAKCGDTLVLAAGATWTGSFTLPAKSCTGANWITIRTSATANLLPESNRVTPCYAGVTSLPGRPAFACPTQPGRYLARIEAAGSAPAFQLLSGASRYRLIGLEITRRSASGVNYALINLQSGSANRLVIDRSWLHGSPKGETVRGVDLSGMSSVAIVDSYFNDFFCESVSGACTDAQAISGGLGSVANGTYKIVNNFLESAGENILFGGGRATEIPTDLEIRRNHFFKPLNWMTGHPAYIGGPNKGNPMIVKNLFELKNAKRVLFEGNVLENSWGGFSQTGYSILLTPKSQAINGTNVCPLCEVTDVTIRYNRSSHTGGGMQIANVRSDAGGEAAAGERYSIHDTIFDDIDGAAYRGGGVLFQLSNDWTRASLNEVRIEHVTGFTDPLHSLLFVGNKLVNPPMSDLIFVNNIVVAGKYPVWSTGGGTANCAYPNVPVTSLAACFKPYQFTDNLVIGGSNPLNWPAGNAFPASASAVGFVNWRGGVGGDYRLAPGSPYRGKASDGRDPGADVNLVDQHTFGVAN